MYEKPLFYSDGYVLHGLTKFGDLERLAPRSILGSADWYTTGIPRQLYYYHDLGVTKSILVGNTGDIGGLETMERIRIISNPVINVAEDEDES
jgi:hypothetical protein